jgi:AraC family transcriptional regulator, regulatory protein of adaptative response / methylated-DNA-[protein]-cysteine methyltransferase
MLQTVNYTQSALDFIRVEQAINYIQKHRKDQVDLADIARAVNLSEYHFQRLFSRWAGISPKRFMGYLTKEEVKRLLRDSHNILETAYTSGLSSPGRLHDLMVTYEAVTPGEIKKRGAGITIRYGVHPSPFGMCLVGLTERGICSLKFMDHDGVDPSFAELRSQWPAAKFQQEDEGTQLVVDQIFSSYFQNNAGPIKLHLFGTNFQIKIWEALLRIPPGTLVSYQDVAVYIGVPRGLRAVGRTISSNPIPVLIPCHRVIRKTGELGDYRWGSARKQAILTWELTHQKHPQGSDVRVIEH